MTGMLEFDLYSMGSFDILKHKTYLSSHNGTSITYNENLIEFTYQMGASNLPSPGFRVPINLIPGIPCSLDISARLLKGDRAFVYCEGRVKKKKDNNRGYNKANGVDADSDSDTVSKIMLDTDDPSRLVGDADGAIECHDNRIVPRIHWLVGSEKQDFKIEFVANCSKIFLGILFFSKDVDYHLLLHVFKLTMLSGEAVGIKKSRAKKLIKGTDVMVNFDQVLTVLQRAVQVGVLIGNVMGSAVIVEPRCDPFLISIIDHFLEVLPTDKWNIVVFHGNLNAVMLKGIYGENGRVRLIQLPVDNLSRESYSRLLLYREFYECIYSEHILIFQMDTCLNQKMLGFLDKLLVYDYVGAPWSKKIVSLTEPKKVNRVGNGGLSLRKRSTMIKVCQMLESRPKYQYLWKHHEDQVITSVLHSRLIGGVVKMPDVEVARKFAVESVFYPEPVGIHQSWRWLSTKDFAKLRENMPVIDQLFRGRIY
jgi:hypothetical protein